jgi:two-component system, NarL family, nitrate/nitrite response regulator NarL
MSSEGLVSFASPTNVVVVAEVRLYREGLVSSLASREGLTVLGAAGDRANAVMLVTAVQPDVIVLDMATRDSLDIVRKIREAMPTAKILAFAVDESERDIFACAEAGVAGFVTCEGSMDDLVATIARCTRGELLCSPRITAMLFRRLSSSAVGPENRAATLFLTTREQQIVSLIDTGLSNKEIAHQLGIEVPTVKNHVHNILEKLSVTSRAEAAARLRTYSSGRAAHGPAPASAVAAPEIAPDLRHGGRRQASRSAE